ncbi:MAG: hypothetical protein AB1595_02240 [bacterium]
MAWKGLKKAKEDILIERIEDIEIPFAGLKTMIELKKGLREIAGFFLRERKDIKKKIVN